MAASYDNLGIDPEYLGPEEERERKVRARIFDVARKAAGQIPFMEDVIAAYYCALDPATPPLGQSSGRRQPCCHSLG